MSVSRLTLGRRGEQLVASRLQQAGCTILARNWRGDRSGELDLVVEERDTLVFVEVRSRRGPLDSAIDAALQSITPAKRARLLALANAYRAAHCREETPWRIDVIAVAFDHGACRLEIIRDAIEW